MTCAPGNPLWGNYIVPNGPRGFFRTIRQAQDAAGCARLYCGCVADAAGIKCRADHWDTVELLHILTTLHSGAAISTPLFIDDIASGDMYTVSSFLVSAYLFLNNQMHGWLTAIDLTTGFLKGWQFANLGEGFIHWWDLNTFTSYDNRPGHGAPHFRPMGHIVTIFGDDAFHQPWYTP